MIQLSPYNRSGIFHNLIACDTKEATERQREQHRNRVVEVVVYRCCECRELHDDEDNAVECCAPDASDGLHHEEGASHCPVCYDRHNSPREAADCCLWKDLDAPTRWRMADQVEAGATWTEALGVHAHG